MASGGAALSQDVANMMKVCYCCPLIEGFGQTETTGPGTFTDSDDYAAGHAGAPTRVAEIKLIDVPSMEYFTNQTPPKGEVVREL